MGVAGAGLSYASQRSAANTQAQFSAINAQAGIQSANQQASVAAMQDQLQATQQQTQQQAAYQTAESQRQEAEINTQAQEENVRRGRDEFLKEFSAAVAQGGGTGAIVATGSPIDVLMNAADKETQKEQDAQWQTNAGRVASFRGAAQTELSGQVAGSNSSLYQIQALSDVQEGREKAAQAQLGGYAGAAEAQGMRNSAFAGLLGGVASNVNLFSNSPFNPWRVKPAKSTGYGFV